MPQQPPAASPGYVAPNDLLPTLGSSVGQIQRPRPQREDAEWWEVIGAGFQNENTLVSAAMYASEMAGAGNSLDPVDGYSAWSDIQGTEFENDWEMFAYSQSPGETLLLKSRLERERENDQILQSAGIGGFFASLAGSVADPTLLIPVGGQARLVGKGVWAIAGAAGRVGLAGAAGTAIQEGVLQSTQVTRSWQESALNIGGAAVLSSLLGGGIAGILTLAERKSAETALENIARGAAAPPPGSIGAMAVDKVDLDDLSMSSAAGFGQVAEGIAKTTQIVSPNLQAQFSPSPVARRVTQMLTENTLFQRMNDEGRSLGPAAETSQRVVFESRTQAAARELGAIFSEAKKAGVGMNRQQFEEAIGRAMRRGDVGENEFVSRGAQSFRKNVIEPFKNEGVDMGLLDGADLNVTTAQSYFPRQYNRSRLVQDGARFKSLIAGHTQNNLAERFAEAQQSLTKRLENAERELADLRMGPDERVATLADLEARGAQLDAASAAQVDRVNRINDLRNQQKAAKSAGDRALVRDLADQVKAEQTAGGADLKAYMAARRDLRSRHRRVDLNYAGLDERHDAILQSLADMEEANVRTLNRIVEKGRKLEREIQKLDPDEAAQRISDLRTSFAQVAEKADKAVDRATKALAKMEDDAAKAVEKGEAPDVAQAAKDAAQRARVEKEIAAQKNRSERMTRLADRLDAEERFDIDATVGEIRQSVDELVREVSDITFARGEKAQRLKDRMARQDKKVLEAREKALEARKGQVEREFDERWRKSLDEDGVGFKGVSDQIAQEVWDKLTGKNYGEAGLDFADFRVSVSRGPLKDRTLNVPDELIEDFLEDNVVGVTERYARTMSADIELTRKFGRADLRDQLTEIKDDYQALRDGIEAGRTPETAKAVEKELKALDEREALDVKNVNAMRDLMRGTYLVQETNGVGGRTLRALQTFNYIRAMGGALISNLTEIARPGMVHGQRAVFSELVLPLLTNIDGLKLSVKEARLVGLVGEMASQHRLMSMAEVGDPYRGGTAIERLLQNGAAVGSRWNGITAITDLTQAMSATLSQNRILAGVAKGAKDDTRFLAYLGIDDAMAERIAAQFKAHGETSQTLKIANTEKWVDAEAVRVYRAAVSKDVNSIIVMKSVGDVPLLANHPLGKAVLQFRTFALASHQRVLLRGLQESKARFASGMAVMTAMGMFVSTVAAWRGGADRWEKFKTKATANPGYLIGEGVDRSGVISLMMEASNTAEIATRPLGTPFNPIKSPMLALGQAMNPSASASADSVRTSGRGLLGQVLGPSFGLIDETIPGALGAAGNIAQGEDVSAAQKRATQSLVPYGSYAGLKEMLQVWAGDSPYTAEPGQ